DVLAVEEEALVGIEGQGAQTQRLGHAVDDSALLGSKGDDGPIEVRVLGALPKAGLGHVEGNGSGRIAGAAGGGSRVRLGDGRAGVPRHVSLTGGGAQ